jgi:soluble lytic murein transglycosylase
MNLEHYTMKKMLRLLLLVPVLAMASSGNGSAGDAESRLIAARDAYRAGEQVRLARIADTLRGHEFSPWVEYWQLRLKLETNSADGVKEFLDRESGSYVAERMRSEWLKQLGKQQDWLTFQREYPPLVQPDTEIVCYSLRARLANQQDVTALDEARPLWFAVTDLPESCLPLMDRLVADGRLNVDDVWMRLRRLIENKKLSTAHQVVQYLPTGQAPDAKSLDAVVDNPARYLTKLPANFAAKRPGRELVLLAVQRMARSDPRPTAIQWRQIEAKFSEAERGYAWGQLAWQAALRHMAEATDWYALAGDTPLSEEQLAWRARAVLRVQDWPKVAAAINAMPRDQAALSVWTYWLGRALAAQGQRDEANVLYLKISGQPSFYGNLADDELGRPIVLPPKALPPTGEEMIQAETHPGLHRALSLLHTDMRADGVREWAWNLRGMDDRQLLAAAELARKNDVFDRAISTADRTLAEHDYSLRYLAPFRDQVEAKAKEVDLDPAWVYGLMRQESRFVMDARSSVGARGLMQLMPATARWVARKIGLSDYHPDRVTETETNVTLGTRYLKMVLDELDDDPVLASAAYNAGPGRARRWRADRPLEAAIYAETIPLNETRDYVKKVMSNAVYYAALFEDKPQSLKSRLHVIRARGATDSVPIDLP